jgi:hypothetical protein
VILKSSTQVNSFAHNFSEGSTFKTSILSQPEWLTETNTELLDPVISENRTDKHLDGKTASMNPGQNRDDFETDGFGAGVVKLPDCSKNLSLGKADGHTEEASRAARAR